MNLQIDNISKEVIECWGYSKLYSILNEKFPRIDENSTHILAAAIFGMGETWYGKIESNVIFLSIIVGRNLKRKRVTEGSQLYPALPYPMTLLMEDDFEQRCYRLVKPNKNFRRTDIDMDIPLSDIYTQLKNKILAENITGLFMPTWVTARNYLSTYIQAVTHFCVVIDKSNLFWVTGETVRLDYYFDPISITHFFERMNCYYNNRLMKFEESHRKRPYYFWKRSNPGGTLRQFLTTLDGVDDVADTVNNNTNNLETGKEDDSNNQVDTDSDNESCADITDTYLPKRPTKKNGVRTTTIGNDKDAMEHIELTDGVGQHLVDQLIKQFKINKRSVEMNEIKLASKVYPDKVFGRVVCINMLKGNSLFGISSLDIHAMTQSTSMVHRTDVFRRTDAKHGFVGFSCRHKSSVFYYSRNQNSIKGNHIPHGSVTDSFLHKFQDHILNSIQQYIVTNNEKKGISLHDIEVNSVQFSVGSGFGRHTDARKGVCFFKDKPDSSECNRLPHVREVVVGTMGFVFDKDGKLILDNEATHCRVTFFDKSTNEKVGSFITKGLFLHLQLHNIQYSCQHEISFLKSTRDPQLVRLICSMRMTIPRKYTGPNQKRHTNVLTCMTDPNFVMDGLHLKQKACTGKAILVFAFKNPCDKYKEIHPSQSVLPRPEGMIITPPESISLKRNGNKNKIGVLDGGKRRKQMYDPKMVMTSLEVFKVLFKAGVSLKFHFPDLKEYINHFDKIGMIGTIRSTSQVRHHHNITSTNHHVNISNLDFRKIDTIVLEHDYKNSVSKFLPLKNVLIHFQQQIGIKDYRPISNLLNSWDDGDFEIFFGPVGGSFEKAGQYANNTINAQIGTTPHQSTFEKQCRFENLLSSRSVIELWIPKSWIWDNDNKTGSGRSIQSVNVGLYYFYKSERRTRENDICCDESGSTFTERHGLLGSWTLDMNSTYHLRPVFSKAYPMPDNYHFCIETMNHCCHPLEFDDDDTQFSVYCNRSCLKRPTFETVSRFAVAAQYATDRLDKRGWVNCRDDGTHEYIKERSEKVTMVQFKNEMIRLQMASWYRRLRYNVDKDGNVGYVRKEAIGWVHGMYPIPPPFRMYDVITSLVITTLGTKNNTPDFCFPRRNRNLINKNRFIHILMAIIILRTTGRTHLFFHFATYIGSDNNIELPDTHQKIIYFKKMMIELSTEEGTMSTFIGVFYKQSLMQRCKDRVKNYHTFLDNCKLLVIEWIGDKEFSFWVNSKETAHYYKKNLSSIFTQCGWDTIPDGHNKELFIAHLCIEDLAELFVDENKCEETYIHGYNGLKAAEVLYLSDYKPLHRQRNDNSTVLLAKTYLRFFYDMINEMSEKELVICGLKKMDDCVVAIINERPVKAMCFAENASCKLAATEYRTSGAMLVSAIPRIHRLFEGPQRVNIPNCALFNLIAKKAITTFESNIEFCNMDISSRYCFPEEKTLWKRFCGNIDTDHK